VREGGDWFARSGLWRLGVPVWGVTMCHARVEEGCG
jgi:hypothetical protein